MKKYDIELTESFKVKQYHENSIVSSIICPPEDYVKDCQKRREEYIDKLNRIVVKK